MEISDIPSSGITSVQLLLDNRILIHGRWCFHYISHSLHPRLHSTSYISHLTRRWCFRYISYSLHPCLAFSLRSLRAHSYNWKINHPGFYLCAHFSKFPAITVFFFIESVCLCNCIYKMVFVFIFYTYVFLMHHDAKWCHPDLPTPIIRHYRSLWLSRRSDGGAWKTICVFTKEHKKHI